MVGKTSGRRARPPAAGNRAGQQHRRLPWHTAAYVTQRGARLAQRRATRLAARRVARRAAPLANSIADGFGRRLRAWPSRQHGWWLRPPRL